MHGTSILSKNNCRVCGKALLAEPLLKYENMPMVAQHLPDEATIARDKGMDLEIYQCAGCGLVQLVGEPVSYYREVIRAAGISPEMKEFRSGQFKDFVKKYSLAGKKIIEIGCGRGEYLTIMSQTGADAYGLEYGDDSAAQCLKNGLKVSKGFVETEDYKIDNSPFDAFFVLSWLEHLPNLNLMLAGISNNLADGAVGIVEVPNFDMILRDNLFSEFMRDHLFYFTKETLKTTLQINGFEVLECKEVWHDYIISAVVKKRRKTDLALFSDKQAKLKKEIEDYINRFAPGKVAVWGAGHQAFATLALLNLEGKIKYVVDSASFKQGKFTPATHIPIVAPEKLNSDPVEAIIIMAGSYADEVAKIIHEKYNGMAVLILN